MNIDCDQIGPMLESIASVYPLPNSYDRCIAFMLSGLGLVRDQMPGVARNALAQATRYWASQNQDVSLEDQKVMLWKHLDRMARTHGGDVKEEALLRSVLFVLDVRPATEDVLELLDWFIQFLCQAGARDTEVAAQLQANFPLHPGPIADGR
jgi:hypothetical protein